MKQARYAIIICDKDYESEPEPKSPLTADEVLAMCHLDLESGLALESCELLVGIGAK